MPWSPDKHRPHKRKRRILGKKKPGAVPEWLASKIAESDVIVGADECGWGCVAGPLVVAACILPRHYTGPLFRDSKKYSSERTRQVAEALVKEHAYGYAIAAINVYVIEAYGPAAALDLAYRTAINRVLENTTYKSPLILVDGSRKIGGFEPKHYAIPRGDDRIQAIAAASIIGKCWRDRYMTDLENAYPEFKFSTHKGYATGSHYEEIQRHGVTVEHRLNIDYIREMLEKVGTYRHAGA